MHYPYLRKLYNIKKIIVKDKYKVLYTKKFYWNCGLNKFEKGIEFAIVIVYNELALTLNAQSV